MKRILVAGLFHETHTFVEEVSSLADFQVKRGRVLMDCAGDPSPLGGILEFAEKQGWDVVPAADYRCVPSGMVEDEVVEAWWVDFETAWKGDCDAVYLVLHGAMVSHSFPDVEGELLYRVRNLVGNQVPVFGVCDLHANFSAAMAGYAECIVAYRENPHTDAREAAIRAGRLLGNCFHTTRPRMHLHQAKILLPPIGTSTSENPMRALEAAAREMESSEVWAVNIAAGFAFADTPDTGLSFQVVTSGSSEMAELCFDRLERLADDLKEDARGHEESLDAVMPHLRERAGGLTVLVEPADNIGGGAPGDCTCCLRALVDHSIEDAAICINDPQAVTALGSVAIGQKAKLSIGGKGSVMDPGPISLEVELVSRSDGRFELEDKQSHLASMLGSHAEMGPCAVVRHQGVLVLLTTFKTAPFDLGQWRSQGIDPASLKVIVVKAAVAHRRAYDPITARSFSVDTPGPCGSDLSQFPYQNLRPGMWPL
ncbi:MAG: microcystin degradation protein MlrC [Opitutae bacterium]|nr:microcystin degradation protein MlrC [Rhodospirillaceae bacterium]MBL61856.1 microcystin degradation protein MlrC [Opitutae bacterium]